MKKVEGTETTKNLFFCFFYPTIFFHVSNVNRKVVYLQKTYHIGIEIIFLRLGAISLGGIFLGRIEKRYFLANYL